MSTIVTKNVQIGADSTASNNFTWRQPASPDGTVRLANGNTGSTTDLVTVDSSGNVGVGTTSPTDTGAYGKALDVQGSGGCAVYVRSTTTPATNYGYIGFTGGTSNLDIWNNPAGNIRFYNNGSERARIDSSGNLLVGTTGATSNSRLAIKGSSTSASDLNFFFVNSAGSTVFAAYNNGALYADNMKSGAGTNAVRFSTSTGQITYDTSSARYKDNIRDSIYGLNHVMKMRSTQFEYKDDGRSDVGLIAEELDPIIPELVGKNKDGQPDSVSYDRMVSVLVKAIQEQQALIQTLTARIEALEGKA